ncbi:CD209 antigen-like protein A [Engraulis encrasicolus]|uniref:CD209 antigen-like protein A n=1 Tax=Engraulis encrasicolus TaxID=184585 RepID=UPI002FCEE6A4
MALYENTSHGQHSQTQTSEQRHNRRHKGYTLYIIVVVSFLLLCVLQASLNVYFWHAGKSCPTGWLHFGSSCYYISNKHKNWTESREACQKMDAELMIISSPEEQELLKALSIHMWIGLSYNGKGWIWVDGSPLTTGYWLTGEPNHHEENCVENRPGFPSLESWNDARCECESRWICKRTG